MGRGGVYSVSAWPQSYDHKPGGGEGYLEGGEGLWKGGRRGSLSCMAVVFSTLDRGGVLVIMHGGSLLDHVFPYLYKAGTEHIGLFFADSAGGVLIPCITAIV